MGALYYALQNQISLVTDHPVYAKLVQKNVAMGLLNQQGTADAITFMSLC